MRVPGRCLDRRLQKIAAVLRAPLQFRQGPVTGRLIAAAANRLEPVDLGLAHLDVVHIQDIQFGSSVSRRYLLTPTITSSPRSIIA